MKLLLIEDDLPLAESLCQCLKKNNFAVDLCQTYSQAEINLDVNEYDCLILDINLPDGSGLELLQHLRERQDITPVIIMTARGKVDDRVTGLNLGADDYLAKPIDSSELIARIRAVIRRNSQQPLPCVQIKSLTIIPAQQSAFWESNKLDLTSKEFAILEYLAWHAGQVITRSMLMEHIWGSDLDRLSNVIDVYIRNIRRKIEQYTSEQLIKTIRGKGYVLESNDQ